MYIISVIVIIFSLPVLAAEKYLSYQDMASCLERSRQQCVAQGCDGVSTKYWWRCTEMKDGTAVLVIEPDRADFDVTRKGTGLTAQEQSALKDNTGASVPKDGSGTSTK